MGTNQENIKIHRLFSSAFFAAFSEALSEVTGSPWLIAAVPDARVAQDGSEPVRVKLTLAGSLPGEFHLEFHRGEAAMLAGLLLTEPAEHFGRQQSEALLKLTESATDRFCSALAEKYGAFTIKAALTSEAATDVEDDIQITVADEKNNRVSIHMDLNPDLCQKLAVPSQDGTTNQETLNSITATQEETALEQVNLSLVMDVELNVTLRFGQRQLTLREVLELTSGSVVELDRQVEEPVELLLEGRVIARGEAVVIDGNYGLRVTEVSQPILSPALR